MVQFQILMAWCIYFYTYRFNIWGFSFSMGNVIIATWVFDICMTYVGRALGKPELED